MPETPPQGQPDEAMVDLLIKQVTEGLSSAEQRELDVMDSASAYLRDFERAAAAVTLAGSGGGDDLPAELAQRIARQADEHFVGAVQTGAVQTGAVQTGAVQAGAAATASLAAARDARNSRDAEGAARRDLPVRSSRSGTAGWLAAAACLIVAVVAWMRTPTPSSEPPAVAVVTPPAVMPPAVPLPPPTPPTPAEERAAMLAKSDSVKVTLGATKDPAAKGVSGDVVWDPVTQKGFLHFVGLASNDPAVSQYQIWIFDAQRDKRYPIDAGVFDVPANSDEVVIPINATLPVSKLAAFAVTAEKPGGVVVSARQHLIALGAAG